MTAPRPVDYLGGYPPELREKAQALKEQGVLLQRLQARYEGRHEVQNNAALRSYAMAIKQEFLKSSKPLAKVRYHDRLNVLHRALGLHTYAVRVQGNRLKASNEMRIASIFKDLPAEFLRMVVVHELAHLRHKDHDKPFYRLCCHMEPEYHRYELDLRLWLYATK